MSNPAKEQQLSRIKVLLSLGKEQGYLTYSDVNDYLPDEITDPERIEEVIQMNFEKLSARYPEGAFSIERSENRVEGDL